MRVLTVVKTSTGAQWIVPLNSALVARGHDVLVLVPNPHDSLGTNLRRAGVSVEKAPAPVSGGSPLQQGLGLLKLRSLVAAWDPDVVNYHLYSSALAGRFACAGTRAQSLYMIPGPLYLDSFLIRSAERLLLRLDDHIICSSSDIYKRYRRLGAAATKLTYVPYGEDLEYFAPASASSRDAIRNKLGIDQDEFVAICVAWFYPPKRLVYRGRGIKGHDVLLRAWAGALRDGMRGKLILAGDGVGAAGKTYREEMRGMATELGLDSSVLWLGHVSDVRDCYAAADVSIAPSRSESYGSVGQASAQAIPTIGSRVGGIPELVLDGATGWTFAAGDVSGLRTSLQASADLHARGMLTSLGNRARRFVQAVAPLEQTVSEYCDVVESMGKA
jgi:glycosyltransferase involved in cell wall biosynthesis